LTFQFPEHDLRERPMNETQQPGSDAHPSVGTASQNGDARDVIGGQAMTPRARRALIMFWLGLAAIAIGGVTFVRCTFRGPVPPAAASSR
jgi:hypothetical protein